MLALLVSLALAQTPSEHTFAAGIRTLDLTSANGDVTVTTGGDAIWVRGVQPTDDSMCGVSFGDASVSFGPRGTANSGRSCTMDFEVRLPSGADLEVKLGTGHIEISHDGSLHADIGTGTVRGTVGAPSRLTLGTGEVQLLKLAHPLELTIGKGAADLGWSKAPDGTILVNLASGELRVDLPDDAPVDARVPPSVKVPLTQKTTAPTKLMIQRDAGVVIVQ